MADELKPEERARIKIDEQLADAGWHIADRGGVTYEHNAIALVEGLLEGNKEADYLLFVDGKGNGVCVQKDDMQEIYPRLSEAEVLVFATPIYYFTMSAQIQAPIQRIYNMNKPGKLKKMALLASSYSPGVYDAAIGEAAFMIGLENTQDVVALAAYAPLFANAQHLAWSPNLINVVSDGSFVNPSWNIQKLFSENRGSEVLKCKVDTPDFDTYEKDKNGETFKAPCVVASAVLEKDGTVILKIVNSTEEEQQATLNLRGKAKRILFTGPDADACNSLFDREALKEIEDEIILDGSPLALPPLSLTILKIPNS